MSFTITPTRKMQNWSVEVTSSTARFSLPTMFDQFGIPYLRVWPGHGFGVATNRLDGFYTALAEVMKKPVYWQRRSDAAVPAQGAEGRWSAPLWDEDDRFVYLSGPAGPGKSGFGYLPHAEVELDLDDLRCLRIRIASYLAEQLR